MRSFTGRFAFSLGASFTLIILALIFTPLKASAMAPEKPKREASSGPDFTLLWNSHALEVLQNTAGSRQNPGYASRSMAILHAAIFDTLNSFEGRYASYLYRGQAQSGLDSMFAVSGAAYEVLARLYPDQKTRLNRQLKEALKIADSTDRRSDSTSKVAGQLASLSYGYGVANRILSARENDGWDTRVKYNPGTKPGDWVPTYPDYSVAWGPNWGSLKPFVIRDAALHLPGPPPALSSDVYARQYEEVKALGALKGSSRTAEQTEIGYFWAYDRVGMGTPIVLYNRAIQNIAKDQGNNRIENARLFALANMAMADAGIVAWASKFTYNFWRPITAIQQGDRDGNPRTQGDPNWIPLGAPGASLSANFTPPFPTYSSGHATFGAAAFKVVEHFYGTDAIQFSLTSQELPGVSRTFRNLTEAIEENGRSRVYLGIHFDFDSTSGIEAGSSIAKEVFRSVLN